MTSNTPFVPDMTGKTVLIAGASSGIGAAAACRLAAAAAVALPNGRSPDRTRALAEEIGAKPYLADLSHVADVDSLAAEIKHDHPVIDVICHNAGGTYSDWIDTVDGHELTIQTNYLAAFLLNHRLIGNLLASPAPWVAVTSNVGHHWGGCTWTTSTGTSAATTGCFLTDVPADRSQGCPLLLSLTRAASTQPDPHPGSVESDATVEARELASR